MIRRPFTMTLLLLLAFVIVPIGGTHLHLCFDGQEPPVSLHVTDGDAHHSQEQSSGTHDDVDVSLLGEVAAKKFDRSFDSAPPPAVAAMLLLPRLADGVWVPHDRAAPAPPFAVFRLLPPLRGPPV